MQNADERDQPVKAKAVLIDPASMTVVWMNESASHDFSRAGSASSVPADRVLRLTGALGVPEAVRAVADTGISRHLRTDLVSTPKGSVAIVTSIYRLPDGKLLVLTENAWQPGRGTTGGGASPRSGRHAR